MRTLFTLTLLTFITACSHPLEIVGGGNIASSNGQRDCSMENQPCKNLVAVADKTIALSREFIEFVDSVLNDVDAGLHQKSESA